MSSARSFAHDATNPFVDPQLSDPPTPLRRNSHGPDQAPARAPRSEFDSIEDAHNYDPGDSWTHRLQASLRRSLLELGTWTIGLITLLCTVAVLKSYEDKKEPDFKGDFGLNSLLAFLGAITAACYVVPVAASVSHLKWAHFKGAGRRPLRNFENMDQVSRGDWLAIGRWLWLSKCSDVACLGGLIIVSAFFSTFLYQNLIRTYIVNESTRNPTLNASAITNCNAFGDTGGPDYLTVSYEAVALLAAAVEGILSYEISEIPLGCNTGNCTYPMTPTLGVCGACKDMKPADGQYDCSGTTCEFQIPNGLLYWTGLPENSPEDDFPVFNFGEGSGAIFDDLDIVGGPNPSVQIGSWDFVGQAAAAYTQKNPTTDNGAPVAFEEMTAFECGLWYCMQARYANVSNAVVTQDINVSWTQADQEAGSGSWIFRSVPDNMADAMNVTAGVRYSVTTNDRVAFALNKAFSGRVNNHKEIQDPLDPNNAGVDSGDIIRAVWQHADDMEGYWQSLTRSLSNAIRLNGNQVGRLNRDTYAGSATSPVNYIHVNWAWLAFPAVLTALSLFVWVWTVVTLPGGPSSRAASSTYAMLYARLSPELHDSAQKAILAGDNLDEAVGGEPVLLSDSREWEFH